jgi:hypothetical protein
MSKHLHLHFAILIIAVVVIAACGAGSSIINMKMVDQVNKKLPKDLRIVPFGWYYPKIQSLHRHYRQLFPDGKLLWHGRVLLALMLASCVASMWALGFFGV